MSTSRNEFRMDYIVVGSKVGERLKRSFKFAANHKPVSHLKPPFTAWFWMGSVRFKTAKSKLSVEGS